MAMKKIVYTAPAGIAIDQAARNVVRKAASDGVCVTFEFNEIKLTATPRTTAEGLVSQYYAVAKERHRQHEARKQQTQIYLIAHHVATDICPDAIESIHGATTDKATADDWAAKRGATVINVGPAIPAGARLIEVYQYSIRHVVWRGKRSGTIDKPTKTGPIYWDTRYPHPVKNRVVWARGHNKGEFLELDVLARTAGDAVAIMRDRVTAYQSNKWAPAQTGFDDNIFLGGENNK